MKPLQDSNHTSIAQKESISTKPEVNFKILDHKQALAHITKLQQMLGMTLELVNQGTLRNFTANEELATFITLIKTMMSALHNRIECDLFLQKNDAMEFSIDPSHSGYPVFVRDLHFLKNDRSKAQTHFPSMPTDEQLVEDAIFSLYRGVFPRDVIETKMLKEYYADVLQLPESLQEIRLKTVYIAKEGDYNLFRVCVERFEEHLNLPRFYVLHIRIPTKTNTGEELANLLLKALQQGFSTTVSRELPVIAANVEGINGIQLDLLQRVDLGPIYNSYTHRETQIELLLDKGREEDSIFLLRLSYLQRISENKVSGVGNWLRALSTGDWHRGKFSPVLVEPTYSILPHRLIQIAHHADIKLDKNVKMFGIGASGGLVESTE